MSNFPRNAADANAMVDRDIESIRIQIHKDLSNIIGAESANYKCRRCGDEFISTLFKNISSCICNHFADLINKYASTAKELLDKKIQELLNHSKYIISAYEEDIRITEDQMIDPDRKIDEFVLDDFMLVSESIHFALKYLYTHTYADELVPFDREMLTIQDDATLIALLKKCEISKGEMALVLERVPDFIDRFM